MANLNEKIKSLLEPEIKKCDCDLYDLYYKDKILTVLLDSDKGIDLDKCEEVSNRISSVLDKEDPIKEEYTLEVASAGVERPLISEDQYLKAIDKYILIHTSKLYEGYDEIVGYLKEYTKENIKVEIKIKTRKLTITIDKKDIIDCMTTVEI